MANSVPWDANHISMVADPHVNPPLQRTTPQHPRTHGWLEKNLTRHIMILIFLEPTQSDSKRRNIASISLAGPSTAPEGRGAGEGVAPCRNNHPTCIYCYWKQMHALDIQTRVCVCVCCVLYTCPPLSSIIHICIYFTYLHMYIYTLYCMYLI